MRRFIISLIALSIAFSSVLGADVVKKHNVSGNANGLSISTFYKVALKQGPLSVVTKASPEIANYVVVKMEAGVVKIGLDLPKNLQSGKHNWNLEAEVSIPSIETLNISGTSVVNSEGTFSVSDMNAHISGASKVNNLVIEGAEADFDLSGASIASVTANVKELELEVSGSAIGNVSGKADDLSVDCSGASKTSVKGEFSEVSVDCSGVSATDLSGKATRLEADCSGSSSINAYNMLVENVEVEASGASSVNANVLKKIEIELSGASHLSWKGADSVNVIQKSVSKGCSVSRK